MCLTSSPGDSAQHPSLKTTAIQNKVTFMLKKFLHLAPGIHQLRMVWRTFFFHNIWKMLKTNYFIYIYIVWWLPTQPTLFLNPVSLSAHARAATHNHKSWASLQSFIWWTPYLLELKSGIISRKSPLTAHDPLWPFWATLYTELSRTRIPLSASVTFVLPYSA